MSMEIFLKIREMGKELKEKRIDEVIDFTFMTAPCGLPCFECYFHLAQFDQEMAETIGSVFNVSPEQIKCKGCRAEDGKCAHHTMECRVYKCDEVGVRLLQKWRKIKWACGMHNGILSSGGL
jgi:hypothetical protein